MLFDKNVFASVACRRLSLGKKLQVTETDQEGKIACTKETVYLVHDIE